VKNTLVTKLSTNRLFEGKDNPIFHKNIFVNLCGPPVQVRFLDGGFLLVQKFESMIDELSSLRFQNLLNFSIEIPAVTLTLNRYFFLHHLSQIY
jgi:hypothetical protein